jgi:uncharacterized protein (TIGR03437 family)
VTLTEAVAGPYYVDRGEIDTSAGHPFLIRGTQLPTLRLDGADSSDREFGPYSATGLVTVRQRFNMNSVRIPVSIDQYLASQAYRQFATQIIESANSYELLTVITADVSEQPMQSNVLDFWRSCAAEFRDHPNVMFAIDKSMTPPEVLRVVAAIRASKAEQPIILPLPEGTSNFEEPDPNVIYEITGGYPSKINIQAAEMLRPLIVRILGPRLNTPSPDCAAFPADPTDASAMVEDTLGYLDAHQISWTVSRIAPGELVSDFRNYYPTKLDDGWNCADAPENSRDLSGGIGMLLLAHLWNIDPHGLIVTNSMTGGVLVARGALATAYGPVLSNKDEDGGGRPSSKFLGNIAIQVTDARGSARFAHVIHTGAGWSYVDFIVPPESSPGPAQVAIVRLDGSTTKGSILVVDVAPGLSTGPMDGRGAVEAEALIMKEDGSEQAIRLWQCTGVHCQSVPVPISRNGTTRVRLRGAGFHNAADNTSVRVTIAGVSATVVSFGPLSEPGLDQVTISVPAVLRNKGESDLVMTVGGRLSNVSRINCGASD